MKQLMIGAGAVGAAGALVLGLPANESDQPAETRSVAASHADDYELCLKSDLPFFEGETKGCYGKDDTARLRNAPVLDNAGDPVSIELAHPTNHESDPMRCTTCAEYAEMSWSGWYAPSSREMRREAYFIRACGVIALLEAAEPPARSFFGEEGLSQEHFAGLDISTLLAFSANDQGPYESLQISSNRDGEWTVARDGDAAVLQEIAYADFNRDGAEDILVFMSAGPEDGTARVFDYGLLERPSETDSVRYTSMLNVQPS